MVENPWIARQLEYDSQPEPDVRYIVEYDSYERDMYGNMGNKTVELDSFDTQEDAEQSALAFIKRFPNTCEIWVVKRSIRIIPECLGMSHVEDCEREHLTSYAYDEDAGCIVDASTWEAV